MIVISAKNRKSFASFGVVRRLELLLSFSPSKCRNLLTSGVLRHQAVC